MRTAQMTWETELPERGVAQARAVPRTPGQWPASPPVPSASTTHGGRSTPNVAARLAGNHRIGLDELPHIGHPAIRALRSAGFPTLQQLAGAPRQQLLALRDVGPKALKAIEKALQQHGLTLS